MPRVDERYDAEPESVRRARSRCGDLAAAMGADDDQVERVRLAVSEAVTNAVVHGYRGASGEIHISARVRGGALSIVVRDRGAGLARRPEWRGLGLGLGLIAQVADEMEVSPAPGGGTVLRMRFDLARQREVAVAA